MTDVIGGRNPVLEALRSGSAIQDIIIAEGARKQGVINEIIELAQKKGIPVRYERNNLSHQLISGQGVIARRSATNHLSLNEVLAQSSDPIFLCVLDGIEDPQNFGAILRTADAAGVHGVIIRERRAVGLTPVVAKASAGAIEYVRVATVVNIARTLDTLKENGLWIVGIESSGSQGYHKIDYRMPVAIVIGSEGRGISDLVKKKCDLLVSIPMAGKISSLNASVAAALVMYEVYRQRSF